MAVGCPQRPSQQSSENAGDYIRAARVSFWVDADHLPVFDCFVEFPLHWTPRIYLAVLKLSILRNDVCLCNIQQPTFFTLGTVHMLFGAQLDVVMSILQTRHAFILVLGGLLC